MMHNGVVLGDVCESSAARIPAVGRGTRPGILIYSHSRKLLHMNRRAMELTGHLDQTDAEPTKKLRSASIHELRQNIQETLDHRRLTNISELFELRRLLFEAGRTIRVRGFGLAGRYSDEDSRIVMVLEEIEHSKEQGGQAPVAVPSASTSGVTAGDFAQQRPLSGATVAQEDSQSRRVPSLDRMQQVRMSERSVQ
ncbi:MAG: hypothetical protein Q7U39_00270 [Nitrospira sp.]|nr:hypothetical protein [Nitrospira sp.]